MSFKFNPLTGNFDVSGIPEAPSDSKQYARKNAAWEEVAAGSAVVVTKTATYSIDPSDSVIICTANSFTVTLPTAVGCSGKEFTVANSGSGTITLATTSSQTISGDSAESIYQNESFTVVSDGSNWHIL